MHPMCKAGRLAVRQASIEDAIDVLRWRNDPLVRAMSRHHAHISEDAHMVWYESALSDPNRILLIGTLGNRKIGIVRFDLRHAFSWEVSIALAKNMRGKGLGRPFLEIALEWIKMSRSQATSVLAVIRFDNESSLRLFESLGFRTEGATGEFMNLALSLKTYG